MNLCEQFQNENYRFVKIRKGEKKPMGDAWQDHLFKYNDPEFIKHLEQGGNYGQVGGFGNIINLDCDSPETCELARKHLPETFTVLRKEGKEHRTFSCPNPPEKAIGFKDGKNDAGEIQGFTKQMVGPGSIHESGDTYKIVNDVPIAEVSLEQVKFVFRNYLKKIQDTQKNKPEIDDQLKVMDVVDTSGLKLEGNEYRGPHPIHGSSGGVNFFVNPLKNTWHCFRTSCDSGGGPLQWIAVAEGIIDCGDSQPGALRGEQFKQVLKIAQQKYGLKIPEKKDKFKIKNALGFFTDYLQMADKFIETQPIFYTTQKIWWMWNFEIKAWEMVDEIDLLNQINEATQGMRVFEAKTKTEVINALKMRGRLNTPKKAKKTWLQFKGTIYDVEENKTFEATPEYFITNPIPWELGESEETPEMDKLFLEWVAKEDVQTLYEIMAFGLLPDYPIHRVFCLNGEGRNGKGSFLRILTELIGERNICSTDFDILINRPFESAKLYRKLICMMGEINSGIFKKTSLFKKLTGADLIGFEMKGKDGFDDYNYAKLLIATNKLPESTDKTVGFYARWRIIDFNNIFEENPKLLDRIPKGEYNNLAKKCCRLLKEVIERGKFTGDGKIEERMKRYEERASPIREFLKKECIENPDYEVPLWQLFEEYESYLAERGFRKASKREFINLLKARGFTLKRIHYKKSSGEDSTMNVFVGVCLANAEDEAVEELRKRQEMGSLKSV